MGVTTDVQLESGVAGMKKRTSVFLKKAYLQGHFSDAAIVQAGVIGTPWIGHEEGLMKHRYVTKTFVDTYGFDSSADAGIGLKGKLADGLLDYHITEINGGGYGNISKANAVDFNGRIGIYPVDGLTLDLQFRDGYKASKKWNAATLNNTAGTKHTLLQAMLTYGSSDWRVGGNYISEKANNKALAVNPNTKNSGYAVWAWGKFTPDFGAFGRFEGLDVKQDGALYKAKTKRYVAGLEWFARKNVSFSAAYDYSKTTNNGFVLGNFAQDTKFGLYSEIKF